MNRRQVGIIIVVLAAGTLAYWLLRSPNTEPAPVAPTPPTAEPLPSAPLPVEETQPSPAVPLTELPVPAPAVVAIEDQTTIDFSSGVPVVTPADDEDFSAALAEMEAATADLVIEFPADEPTTPGEPAPAP